LSPDKERMVQGGRDEGSIVRGEDSRGEVEVEEKKKVVKKVRFLD
jgi:hypothetical protein